MRGKPFTDGDYMTESLLKYSIYFPTPKTKLKWFRKLEIWLPAKTFRDGIAANTTSQQISDINSDPADSITYNETKDGNNIEHRVALCRYANSAGSQEEIIALIPLQGQTQGEHKHHPHGVSGYWWVTRYDRSFTSEVAGTTAADISPHSASRSPVGSNLLQVWNTWQVSWKAKDSPVLYWNSQIGWKNLHFMVDKTAHKTRWTSLQQKRSTALQMLEDVSALSTRCQCLPEMYREVRCLTCPLLESLKEHIII